MTSFEVHFYTWEEENVTRIQVGWIRGLRSHRDVFTCQKLINWNRYVTRRIVVMQDPVVLDVCDKCNSSPIILTISRQSERTNCRILSTLVSFRAVAGRPLRFIFNRLSSFWKCFKPPKHLRPWQNNVSIGLLKFCKRFCHTVPKSEAKPDRTPLLDLTVKTHSSKTFYKTNRYRQRIASRAFPLALNAHRMSTRLSSKRATPSVTRSHATLSVSLLYLNTSYDDIEFWKLKDNK